MRKWILSMFALWLCVLVSGQTSSQTVVPLGFEGQVGNASDSILFGGHNLQQLFRASALPSSWDSGVKVTGVAFRVADGATSMTTVIPRIEIYMSTTSVAPGTMSALYSVNKGSDEVTVFTQDNVSLSGTGGNSVNPFDVRITFNQPFAYDPHKGNLLMYIKTSGENVGARSIDSHLFGDLSTTPVAGTGTSTPFAAGTVAAYGLVNEFSWVAIPEPSITLQLLASMPLFIEILRRRRN